MNILLLEDDELSRIGLSTLLKTRGKTVEFSQGNLALREIEKNSFDLAFIDLDLEEELIGLEVLSELAKTNCYCVVLTGRDEQSTIMRAYELGAKDYLVKPIEEEVLDAIFSRYQTERLLDENSSQFSRYIPKNIKDKLRAFAFEKQPILITGETGVGKTECAKSLHDFFKVTLEKDIPFISLNATELNENLIESELFGHVKGAFTGASCDKVGLLEKAHGGILFLDEIATLSSSIQKKLLKTLDEKTFTKVGSSESVQVEFILISATCEPIEEYVKENKFREDLYQRLKGLSFKIPSFRDLKEFEKKDAVKSILSEMKRKLIFTEDALEFVCSLPWKGNYRELKNFIGGLVSRGLGVIDFEEAKRSIHLELEDRGIEKEYRLDLEESFKNLIGVVEKQGLPETVRDFEEYMIKHFYNLNENKARATISKLKISNNQFYKYIKK